MYVLSNRSQAESNISSNSTSIRDENPIESSRGPTRVRIVWYKDGRRVKNSRKVRIKQKRLVQYRVHISIKNQLKYIESSN